MMRNRTIVLLLSLGIVACDRSAPTSPSLANTSAAPLSAKEGDGGTLVVMTQNIGPGANVDPIIEAEDPTTIPMLATQAWQQLLASDMPGRAAAVAALIDEYQPQVVGLQEVVLYRTQHPSDAIVGGTTPATDTAFDYLKLLMDALQARGATYVVANVVQETDAEVPMVTGGTPEAPTFDDARFTDRDVILVRGDVPFSRPRGDVYQNRLPLALGGPDAYVLRGWGSVDLTVDGGTVRFFSTHLEDQHSPPTQLAQAHELTKLVHVSPYPVVVVGDFNSAANVYQTPTYGFLTGAGKLVDTWPIANPQDEGLTCCYSDALNEPSWMGVFDQRLDFVFLGNARSSAEHSSATHEKWNDWLYSDLAASVIGLDPGDRTASGLWPSDHAGILATLRLK